MLEFQLVIPWGLEETMAPFLKMLFWSILCPPKINTSCFIQLVHLAKRHWRAGPVLYRASCFLIKRQEQIWMHEFIHEWMNKWMNEWMNEFLLRFWARPLRAHGLEYLVSLTTSHVSGFQNNANLGQETCFWKAQHVILKGFVYFTSSSFMTT